MSEGISGQQQAADDATDVNVMAFAVRQALSMVMTGIPVSVVAVRGGGVGPPPVVDVTPLVNMLDGQGTKTAHGNILNIPVIRLQGGKNAIIMDPVKGDIGWLLVAHRDISAVVKNKGKVSNPGSYRRHNLADGAYLGGILNQDNPTGYVQLTPDGIVVLDKNGNKIEMKSGEIDITATTLKVNGDLHVTGAINSDGAIGSKAGVTAGVGTGDSVGLQTHNHPGNGLPPTPGS